MKTRRNFIKLSAIGSVGLLTSSCLDSGKENGSTISSIKKIVKPFFSNNSYYSSLKFEPKEL